MIVWYNCEGSFIAEATLSPRFCLVAAMTGMTMELGTGNLSSINWPKMFAQLEPLASLIDAGSCHISYSLLCRACGS
jgi:hypothetical protein